MNNKIRILLVAIILSGVVFLARNRIPWAQASALPDQAEGELADLDPQASIAQAGSVNPPPAIIRVTGGGTYSVGGCTLQVEVLDSGYTLQLTYLTRLQYAVPLPPEAQKFLAGICLVTFYHNGIPIDKLEDPEPGNVTICFAALPEGQGTVYHYDKDEHVWTPLNTEMKDGFICSSTYLTGYYFVAGQ